jgi:hypothetical protein
MTLIKKRRIFMRNYNENLRKSARSAGNQIKNFPQITQINADQKVLI